MLKIEDKMYGTAEHRCGNIYIIIDELNFQKV